jgi:hypothetical protein
MQSILLSGIKGVDKKIIEALKKIDVVTLEELKLIEISQLCKQTKLSETQLKDVLLRAELLAYSVPQDIVNALVASGAIARASELEAFNVEEIQDILKGEVAAKRAEISTDISLEGIAAWKKRVPRMTLDEFTPISFAEEEEDKPVTDEDEPGGYGEDVLVSSTQVAQVIRQINDVLKREEANLKTIGENTGGAVEFSVLQEAITSICKHIKATFQVIGTESAEGVFDADGEEEAPSVADEDVDTEQQIQQLRQQMKDIESQLAYLQLQRVSGDEELSEPAAAEEELEGPRGEEEIDDS